jgi:putative acetyltransferase
MSSEAVRPVVRRFHADDLAGLMSFLDRVFRGMGREFIPEGKDVDVRDLNRIYLANRGAFRVADVGGVVCGSVGVRQWSADIAELKRLYLADEYRGQGIGLQLCAAAIDDARELGYARLRLDTTRQSRAAVRLFDKLGFVEIDRYTDDPFGELFFEKVLVPRP